jgi:ATP-dependent exoDNAse (exonuclease V) beta subunit
MSQPDFTPDQRRALDIAQCHLDTCIVAGPGSGKTTVLVEYFRRLVQEANADPQRILAITFTEKAAANMRKKLAEAFEDRADTRAALERAWVGTVHGFCARLLRENAVFAGIDPEFHVADERESWRLQQKAMADAMESLFVDRPQHVGALIRGLSSADFELDVLSAYDAMRGAGMTVEQVAAMAPPPAGATLAQVEAALAELRLDPLSTWPVMQKQHFRGVLDDAQRIIEAPNPREALKAAAAFKPGLRQCKRSTPAYDRLKKLDEQIKDLPYSLITRLYAAERATLLEILRRFDALYRERKLQAGALDFADLEEFTVRLLETDPEAQARVRAQFDYILMDEFQDTNPQQAKLLGLLRPPDRFYAVGDVNQSIFGFRHAEPAGFREYRDEVLRRGRRHVDLLANFRSRPEILRAIETIAAGDAGIEARSLVAQRVFQPPPFPPVELIVVQGGDITGALRAEAQWVAQRILDLVPAAGFRFQDVAVLVRNTEVIGELTGAFDEAGIPYLVNRGRGFYASREVNDLTHLLRIIANPRDEISLAAVLRSPLVGVSDEALLALKLRERNLGAALERLDEHAQLDADDLEKLLRFRGRLRQWRVRRGQVSFDRLLLAAIDDCGYRPEPAAGAASSARAAANIDKFLAQARAMSETLSLDQFVEELAVLREENPREPDAPPEDAADAVKVMTVHSAKGLEFPVVFVAALHKGVETDPGAVSFAPAVGIGAGWKCPGNARDKDDLFQHEIRAIQKEREKHESSRLFYVAMTRAEKHLGLSLSRADRNPKNWASLVLERLHVDVDSPREEIVTRTAPDGSPWQLRLLVTDRAPGPEAAPRRAEAPPQAEPEPLAVAPPEIVEQHDAATTVTALAEFSRCPRRYYLARYLGFGGRTAAAPRDPSESEADRELAADEFGTQVHEILAGRPVAQPDPEALRLAAVFRENPLGRRVAKAARVEREFDFLMAVDGLVVRGQVDLWFDEGGTLGIVDYKTDSVTASEAHRRAQDYALQLRLYAMAVERVAGRPPERAWLHFLRPNTVVEVDLTPSLLDSPEAIVHDFQDAQSNQEFPLEEGDHCHRCPFFKGICPAGAIRSA